MNPTNMAWQYGQVKSNALNVRREPSRKARRWNNVWPMNRLVLVKPCTVDGWYETLYRGEPAYVMADFIKLLDEPVPENIVERMMFMALPENGRSKSIYFNGYSGKWCHRFADWLAMNAGMPPELLPNTSNCGKGIVWFATNNNSGGFSFKSSDYKVRMIHTYTSFLYAVYTIGQPRRFCNTIDVRGDGCHNFAVAAAIVRGQAGNTGDREGCTGQTVTSQGVTFLDMMTLMLWRLMVSLCIANLMAKGITLKIQTSPIMRFA